MIVAGIDPGKKGGLAIYDVDNHSLRLFIVPQIGDSTDYSSFADLLGTELYENKVDKVFVEEVHSIFGSSAKSNFEFGFINGFIFGVLNTLKIRYELVQPKKWQKAVWNSRDITKKSGSNSTDTKKTSLLASKRIFPSETFLATKRSSVPHDGLVDASLIAYYGSKN